MKRSDSGVLPAFGLGLLMICTGPWGCGDKPGAPDGGVAAKADAGGGETPQAKAEAVYVGPLLSVRFQGEAFAAAYGALAQAMGLPAEAPALSALLDGPLGVGALLPKGFDALDGARAIEANLGEPVDVAAPGVLSTLGADQPLPGLRHVIRVPSKAPDQTLGGWRAHLEGQGAEAKTVGGQQVLRTPQGAWVALSAQGDAVIAVIVSHRIGGEAPAEALKVTEAPAPTTPAATWAATAKAPVVGVLRGAALAPVAATLGVAASRQAIQAAPAEVRGALMLSARAEVLYAEAMMSDEDATFDDHAFAAVGDANGITIQWLSSLTPAGAKALVEGKAPSLSAGADFTLDAAISLDLGAALKATPDSWPWSAVSDEAEITEGLARCGWGCTAYALTRAPLPILKAGARLNGELGAVISAAQGARFALVGEDEAFAVSLKAGADGAAVAKAAAALSGAQASAEGDLLRMYKGKRPLGITGSATAQKELLKIRGDLSQLGAKGKLNVMSRRDGRALLTTISVTAGEVKAPSLDVALSGLPQTWESPTPRGPLATDRCVAKALYTTAAAMKALAAAEDGSPLESQILTQSAQTLANHLQCVRSRGDEHPEALILARGVEGLYAELFTAWAATTWERGQGRAWLGTLCEGEGPACEARDALAKLPAIEHTAGEYPCLKNERAPKAHDEARRVLGRVAYVDDALYLDGIATSIDALPGALKARNTGAPSRVEIAVQGERTFGDLKPVIAAAEAAGADELHAIVVNASGDIERVPMILGLERAPRRATGFSVRMDAEGYEVKGIGKNRRVKVPTGATLADMRAVIRKKGDTSPVYLYAGPSTPWGWVASTAGTMCPVIALVSQDPGGGASAGGAPTPRAVRAPSGDTALVEDPPSVATSGNAQKAQASFRSYVPRVKACYERALKTAGPDFSGRLMLEVEVGPSGEVVNVKAKGMRPLHKCVLGVARRAKFPKGSGPVTLRMPFIFTPQ